MAPMRMSFLARTIVLLLGMASAHGALTVASLSTITTDLARNIGGRHVDVIAIIRAGIDPHEFEPTPGDVKRVANADLVLYTGKGIEGYLAKLEEAAGGSAKFLDIGSIIPTLTIAGEGRTVEDPHWWHSVDNMELAARFVAEAFEKTDPANAEDYERNLAATLTSLKELQRWIRVQVAGLPRSKRILFTSHDALQYFANAYGFTICPVKGVSTNEEPSSRHVREIIHLIREHGVKAIFLESIESPRVVEQISSETGARPGGTLYADGLGEKEASTYDSMMRHNVTTIISGLK